MLAPLLGIAVQLVKLPVVLWRYCHSVIDELSALVHDRSISASRPTAVKPVGALG